MPNCEKCGSSNVVFEKGSCGSWDEPPACDAWFCPDCGHEAPHDPISAFEDSADYDLDNRRERDA